MTPFRRRLSLALIDLAAALLMLAERIDPIEVTPKAKRSVITPARAIALDVNAYRVTKGGDA